MRTRVGRRRYCLPVRNGSIFRIEPPLVSTPNPVTLVETLMPNHTTQPNPNVGWGQTEQIVGYFMAPVGSITFRGYFGSPDSAVISTLRIRRVSDEEQLGFQNVTGSPSMPAGVTILFVTETLLKYTMACDSWEGSWLCHAIAESGL